MYDINFPRLEPVCGSRLCLGSLSRTSVCIIEFRHSLLCVLVLELRKQEETGQLVHPVLFVLLVLVSVLLYFAVSLMDPGFILSDDSDLQVINDPNVYSYHNLRHATNLFFKLVCIKSQRSSYSIMVWLGLGTYFHINIYFYLILFKSKYVYILSVYVCSVKGEKSCLVKKVLYLLPLAIFFTFGLACWPEKHLLIAVDSISYCLLMALQMYCVAVQVLRAFDACLFCCQYICMPGKGLME